MTLKEAKTITNLWNERHAGCTPTTKTEAYYCELGSGYEVIIAPAEGSRKDTFYHLEKLAGICSTFGVSSYVAINYDHIEVILH